jgi:hypothetical protein
MREGKNGGKSKDSDGPDNAYPSYLTVTRTSIFLPKSLETNRGQSSYISVSLISMSNQLKFLFLNNLHKKLQLLHPGPFKPIQTKSSHFSDPIFSDLPFHYSQFTSGAFAALF